MICNTVVTYFTPVPELYHPDSQWQLIEVWKKSWAKAGWDPIVLTLDDVATHPRFGFFFEHFHAKPTEYGQPYTESCFLRYLAAAHYGSLRGVNIMLTDYDVINYFFPPLEPWDNELTIFCDEPPASIFCGAVMGRPHHFLDLCELFAAAKPDQFDWNVHAKMFHQDDLSLISRFFDSKTLEKPAWMVKRPGCALYDYPSWRTSRLVHFGYALKQAGYFPKHEWIERLRPF